jgi:hypothetical protein
MALTQVQGGMILPSTTLTTPIVATTMGVGGATPSTSGSGITFPATQSASTDANTLDDYEEGTWTPTVNSGTATADNRWYVKVGRLVVAGAVLSGLSDRTSASQITVGGLPFVSNSLASTSCVSPLYRYCNTPPTFYIQSSATTALMYSSSSSGYVTFNYNAQNNASAEFYLLLIYQSAS